MAKVQGYPAMTQHCRVEWCPGAPRWEHIADDCWYLCEEHGTAIKNNTFALAEEYYDAQAKSRGLLAQIQAGKATALDYVRVRRDQREAKYRVDEVVEGWIEKQSALGK